MRGRKPKPTMMKVLNGNPGRRRLNLHEPRPVGRISPPAWVDGDTLRLWGPTVAILEGMGVMTVADCETVARYCDAIVLWQRARNFLHQRGSTYPIRSSVPVVVVDPANGQRAITYPVVSVAPYPQVAEYRQLSKLLLSFESEFGLTAAARTRVEVQELSDSTLSSTELAKREFFRIGRRP